jgi:dTDP-4-dehydrorhamnose reductase
MNIDSKELSFFNDKTVLITGAGGMLGRAFSDLIKQHALKCKLISLARQELDVTDAKAVAALGTKYSFDIIIHCAANVNADYCEQHEQECFDVQVTGTENVMNLAKASNAKFLYPQSFLIYGENEGIVDETTAPSPLSVYGKCKFEAEKLLLNNHQNSLIVRMGGFFGGEEKDKNFVGKFIPHIAGLIKKGQPQQEIGHRVWQPTYTLDLAYNSLVLIAKNKSGIYNMAAHGHASFYELAKEVTKGLGVDSNIAIVPADGDAINKKDIATRPSKLVMQNKRLQSENLDFQRGWKESLHEYLNNPYFKNLFS